MGQLASAPGAHPPTRGFRCGRPAGVSGVGGQLGFQLWAPNPVIWLRTTGLQVSAGAAYPMFFRSPEAEGGGAPEARAAEESSLTSP